MRKLLFFAVLFFALSPTAEAGPINWLKHHPRAAKVLAASAAAGIHAKGLEHCRLGDVERCQAGYGAAWASFGVTTSLNFLMIPISEKIGGKQGAVLSFGGSAAQLGFGIHQFRNYKP